MTAAPVHLFEHHDEAYHVWRAAGMRRATVVHVDAHHDLSWLTDRIHLHIGNYLCQAIKDDIAGEIYWVVPDGALSLRGPRAALARMLRTLRSRYPRPKGARRLSRHALTLELVGRRLAVCELQHLPELRDPVLLDVDTDFLMTPATRLRTGYPAPAPWIRAHECVERLRARVRAAAVTTVAYSVEGGYTPLGWRYLGDELAMRLSGVVAGSARRGFDRLWDAHVLTRQGEDAAAERACTEAAACLPNAAAAEFTRALLLARRGRFAEARDAYESAQRHDRSYGTRYNCDGPVAIELGQYDEAERAFETMLAIDDRDGAAHFGLARVAAHRRRWVDVEERVRAALARGLVAPDAYRLLAHSLERQGRTAEAAAAMQRSLCVSLHAAEASRPVARLETHLPIDDIGHARAYATLGRLDARLGRVADAVAALRFAISGGYRHPAAHARLARLYTKQRRWKAALRELGSAGALVPASCARAARRTGGAIASRLEAYAS